MRSAVFSIGLILGVLIGVGLTKYCESRSRSANNLQAAAIGAGGTGKTGEAKWPWADSLDAVNAAPKNHRVLFENDSIRILEVTLKPHEFEQMHTHRLPSVMFGSNRDTSHFEIVYYRNGYDSVQRRYFVKDSIKQHGGGVVADDANKGNYMRPEGPHQIKNLSDVTIDVFRVEFKKKSK
jgi:hypothetical protein